MAKLVEQNDNDDLVRRARTQTDALGRLYEIYYERILRFCVHRLFNKQIAEDITSTVFLEVARRIRTFSGGRERDFRNWVYTIAINQVNAYIRKTSRRKQLLAKAAEAMKNPNPGAGDSTALDWPRIYAAILKLKPEHQTILTLRFFENLQFEQIGRILNVREATVRVTMHRILNKLRNNLQTALDGET